MRVKKVTNKRAFTITELMVTILMAAIVILGTGVLLVDSHRGWRAMYNRVYGGLVDDAYVARKTFNSVVRKSSTRSVLLGSDWVEVYYYADPDTSTWLDRYARFYVTAGNELMVGYGNVDADGNSLGATSTVTLAHNVAAANFSVAGACVQMTLTLDNGSDSLTVMSSPIRYNN
jgi:type II secretory pathway pseudopilin PulG